MPAHTELTREAVVTLYTRLLEGWNARDASAFAAPFASSGSAVGFDGSQLDGREAIRAELARIFTDHSRRRMSPGCARCARSPRVRCCCAASRAWCHRGSPR